MAITLNDNIQLASGKLIDNKYGPYNSVSAALTAVPGFIRARGLTIGVIENTLLKEYWFKEGTADNNLIEKTSSSIPTLSTTNWQNTFTIVQANSATWFAGVVISKTYDELKAMRAASQLVPGTYYKITDFVTKWWNQVAYSSPGSVVLTSSVVEPLTILAIGLNKFSSIAYSDLYPTDIIYYKFEAITNEGMLYGNAIPNFKGCIKRRIDTNRNIDIPLDWKHITVNCCRPDISRISEWSSLSTYNAFDVIKLDSKLYYSPYGNNTNNIPTTYNANEKWRPFTGFNEGLTYFATNDEFVFAAFTHTGAQMLLLSADMSTRTQKYIFDTAEAEQPSTGINNFNSALDVEIKGVAYSNIFLGPPNNIKFESCAFNTIGKEFASNQAGAGFSYNVISNYASGNKFGVNFNKNFTNVGSHPSQRFTSNTFTNNTDYNIFSAAFSYNVCGDIVRNNLFSNANTDLNIIQGNFKNNILPFYFRKNSIGYSFYSNNLIGSQNIFDNVIQGNFYNNTIISGSFFNNVIFPTFYNNTINGSCRQNVILGTCFSNTLSGGMVFNTIGTQCHFVAINGEFAYNTVAGAFSYCNLGSASYNNLGESFRLVTVGNNFRYNVVEAGALLNAGNLTSATHIYNTYSTRIFKNAAGVAKLSYYNSNDQMVIALPSA